MKLHQTKGRHFLFSLLFAFALFFFIISFSIGLPIYFRPFYYAHIDSMHLPEKSGFTETEIRKAYDAVLDYLTLPGKEFTTGVMEHSVEGAAHFADCKALFNLNASALISSAAILLILLILRRHGAVGRLYLGKHHSAFWGAIAAMVLPLIIVGACVLDFDRAFVVFHKLFFPGKDNWWFDYRKDEIIRVLPRNFFMHCALLIGASILMLSICIIITEYILLKKQKR